jgi:hypothetical protein
VSDRETPYALNCSQQFWNPHLRHSIGTTRAYRIDGVKLNNLPLADDIVIIVNLREVIPTGKKVGLNINKQKMRKQK